MSSPSRRIGAGIGRERAGDQVEQRGLAGAVRTDDAERLAGLDGEIDAVGDHQRAEGLADALELQDHASPPRLPRRGRGRRRPSASFTDQAIGSILPPTGNVRRRLVVDDDDVVLAAVLQPPLAADERRLGDVLVRRRAAGWRRPTADGRRSCRDWSPRSRRRSRRRRSTVSARFSTSTATSNSEWMKPIGCVHCLPVAF